MLKKLILTAILSGLIGGIALNTLQFMTTIPLIHHAEVFEGKGLINYTNQHKVSTAMASKIQKKPTTIEEEAWAPQDGTERTVWTLIADIILATGFSFILLAIYLFINNLTLNKALGIGIVSYGIFFFLPSLGLHPELPGTVAASLNARQTWWIGTVVGSAIGFGLIFFNKNTIVKLIGLAIILLPHIIGAPMPLMHAGSAPYKMLESFEYGSFAINGVFWILLSFVTYTFNKKLNYAIITH